jgi:hypothetical protein
MTYIFDFFFSQENPTSLPFVVLIHRKKETLCKIEVLPPSDVTSAVAYRAICNLTTVYHTFGSMFFLIRTIELYQREMQGIFVNVISMED